MNYEMIINLTHEGILAQFANNYYTPDSIDKICLNHFISLL